MSKNRQKLAYIKDKEHLDYANLAHYEKALQATDINTEEYYVQSVFNSPAHAKNLKREVFQSKVRQGVTNKLDPETIVLSNSNVANTVISHELKNNVKYSKVTDPDRVNISDEYSLEPDTKLSLMSMIEQIVSVCDSDQLKVLAYYIASEHIDNIVVEDFSKDSKFDEIRVYILQIWDINVNNINSLNEFIGSKYRTEIARKNLCKLIKDKFPLLNV